MNLPESQQKIRGNYHLSPLQTDRYDTPLLVKKTEGLTSRIQINRINPNAVNGYAI
jgi:hypothetical protein